MAAKTTFNFFVSPSSSYPAFYNSATGDITIRSFSSITVDNLEEEIFHAYQDLTIPGGTAQYFGQPGSANIEFEAKVLHDMYSSINSGAYIGGGVGTGYSDWIISLTNGATFPTSFTQSQRDKYFLFMFQFIQDPNNGYSSDIIDYNLNPTAMFNLINSSACSH
jgi:hypothetical protein